MIRTDIPDDLTGKYTNSEIASLKTLLESDDFEGCDAVCKELKIVD